MDSKPVHIAVHIVVPFDNHTLCGLSLDADYDLNQTLFVSPAMWAWKLPPFLRAKQTCDVCQQAVRNKPQLADGPIGLILMDYPVEAMRQFYQAI